MVLDGISNTVQKFKQFGDRSRLPLGAQPTLRIPMGIHIEISIHIQDMHIILSSLGEGEDTGNSDTQGIKIS